MDDKVVLGVHSHVSANTEGSSNEFIDGHAWISVTRGGRTEVFGLWPDNHPNVDDNGRGTDIRAGLEAGYPATASRYFELGGEQTRRLESLLSENVTWRYTNTCASWASETVERVTGQRVKADDVLGFETPRKLIESIRELEREHPTSLDVPQPANATPRSSGSHGRVSVDGPAAKENALWAVLVNRLDDPQRLQAWNDEVAGHRREFDAAQARADPRSDDPDRTHLIGMA